MLNKVQLIGNLGRDPEVKYTNSGSAVCSFSLATTKSWKDKAGDKQESTEWHNIVVWGKLADICGEHLTKGSKVYVDGEIQTRKWQDKDGNDRYTTEINAKEMKMLSGKTDGGGDKFTRAEKATADQVTDVFSTGETLPF